MVLPLSEGQAALDDFEAIAAVPGIDGFLIGPCDLSVSVGAPGADCNDPAMGAALDRVTALCRANDKVVVTTVGDLQDRDYGRGLKARGVQAASCLRCTTGSRH